MTRSRRRQHRPGLEKPAGPAEDGGVLGLGTDLCAVARMRAEIARSGAGFTAAVFRPDERERCGRHPHPDRAFAACFAAKEAVIKALADGGGGGAFWQDIEIGDDGHGRPAVTLHGRLADLARELGVRTICLSHAHGQEYATACAIVSG